MRINSIRYPNLRKEMDAKKIKIQDIASALGKARETIGEKLSKKRPLFYSEAEFIRDTYFPEFGIDYLFSAKE